MSASQQPEQSPAPPPESSQFDFWVGEWDVTWDGGVGTNTIRRRMGGHVIEEQFRGGEPPLHGMSVSVYSPRLGAWQQTWVDNQGSYLDLAGGLSGGEMILGMERTANGITTRTRMVFYNIAADQLDWRWERSRDGGESWELLWQIHYARRPAAPA
ncbi:MAG: hypothetical protein IPO81_15180 [Kouleothrix sp.]|nr:hypothetical protein [Kouleothrix sp.]